MNKFFRFLWRTVLVVEVAVPLASGQMSSYYQQAAALYDQAAAKCSEPGASCMRQYASYNRCLANKLSGGGGCGSSPSCSTACSNGGSGSGGSGAGGSSVGGVPSGATQAQQLAQSIGTLLSQWADYRAAKKEKEAQDLQRQLAEASARLQAESAAEDERARVRAAFLADPTGASLAQASQGGDDPGDAMARLRAKLYAESGSSDGQSVVPQALTLGDSTMNVQFENLDHPTYSAEIEYGKSQQAQPLYKWSADGTDPASTYCQGQPNVPCQEAPNAAGPRDQFSVPPPVTSPSSSADCDALQASWQQTVSDITSNHAACLANYRGEGRGVGIGLESATSCSFRACQEVHNSMMRASSQAMAAMQACWQAVAAQP